MEDADRFRLLFGPYRPPRFRVGGFLRCEVRGKVRVAGITKGPIPWPVRRQPDALGRRFLIVCGGLVKALHRESELAVAHWWGVTPQTVWTWRKALGVPAHTDGTRQLHREWMPERMCETALKNRAQALRSPERAAKIAAARKGKRHTAETKAKVGAASRGRKPSAEARQKMSEAQKRRGAWPPAAGRPWTADEDAQLGTAIDREIAARIGRDVKTTQSRRRKLRIASFRRHKPVSAPRTWMVEDDRLLGTMPDPEVARRLGCTPVVVLYRRRQLGVRAFRNTIASKERPGAITEEP